MKTLLLVLASVVGITVSVEASLRWFLGLGSPVLYVADEEIGYLPSPNQKTRRGGSEIMINQYSMRSEMLTLQKTQNTTRIFLLGDSIVNGGWWTDQSVILSELVKTELKQNNKFGKKTFEVFNASAKSWNPRHELAYIKKYGLFEADTLVLVINTEDLFGAKPSSVVVGRDRHYPSKKPNLALIELYDSYIPKQPPIPELIATAEEGDIVGFNLEAIKQIKTIAQRNRTELIVVMTPLLQELESGSNEVEIMAKERLKELFTQEQISYLDFFPIFDDFPQPEFLYRDRTHLSPQGEALVSKKIAEAILD